jgi:hypothetical protein
LNIHFYRAVWIQLKKQQSVFLLVCFFEVLSAIHAVEAAPAPPPTVFSPSTVGTGHESTKPATGSAVAVIQGVTRVDIRSNDLLEMLRTRVDQPYLLSVVIGKRDKNSPAEELWFGFPDPQNAGAWIVPDASPLGQRPVKPNDDSQTDYTVAPVDTAEPGRQWWFITHSMSQIIYRDHKYSGAVDAAASLMIFPMQSFGYRWKHSKETFDPSKSVVLEGSPSKWDDVIVEMSFLYPSHRRLIVVTRIDPPDKPFVLVTKGPPDESSDFTVGARRNDMHGEIQVDFEFNPAKTFLDSGTYRLQVWTSIPIFSVPSKGPPPAEAVNDPDRPGLQWRWEEPPDGGMTFEVHRTIGVTGDIISN